MKDKLKKNDPIRRAKRKKAWLVFLRIVLIAIAVIAVFKITDVLVEKTIENAYPSYFEFSNSTDNLQQVTADFKVPLKITSKNGKKHKVKWTENSPYLSIDKEGNVTVKEPEGRNVKVVLCENYGWFIFKGKRQYVLDLVTSNVQQFDSEADIPVDKVINGTYHRDMDIAFDENDNVAYVFGDFGNTKLYNEKDIVAYIEHNRKALNIPDELEIKGNSYSTSKSINTCNLDLYYDGVCIDDNVIVVAVSNEDYKPKKVTCDITRDFSTLNENIEIDLDACKEVLEAYYEVSSLNVSELETVIVENSYCSIVNVEKDGYMPFEVCINKNNYEIIYDNLNDYMLFDNDNTISNSIGTDIVNISHNSINTEDLDPNQLVAPNLNIIMLKGKDEYGKTLEFEGATDGEYIYMYDLTRKIRTYQVSNNQKNPHIDENNPIDYHDNNGGTFLYNYNASSTGDPFIDVLSMIIKVDHKPVIVNSKEKEFDYTYGVESEIFNQTQVSYDLYYKEFGWRSYDNQESRFNIYTNVDRLDFIPGIKYKYFDDGMAWVYSCKGIVVGQNHDYLTNPAVDPNAITHEYSHGVLSTKLLYTNSTIDEKALQEAFGDVMGLCLNHDKTWEIAKIKVNDVYLFNHPSMGNNRDICFRDLKDPNGGIRYAILGKKVPTYYDDSLYNDDSDEIDEHDRGLLLGNIAYKMHESGEFSQDEIARIWYHAVSLGFDKEVTLPRFRTNVIEAIEMGGKERQNQKIELVEELFDEKHIYDESILGRFSRIAKIVKSENNSIEGDPLLDDTYVNSYYMFYSPIAFTKKNPTIFLIESTSADMPKTDKTTKKIGKDIEHYINKDTQLKKDHEELLEAKRELDQVVAALKELLGKDSDAVSNTSEESTIQVVYLRVPKYLMIAIQKANENQGVQVKESILDAFTEDEDSKFWQLIVDFIWRLMFHDEYYESTAYDFYSSL